MAGRGCKDLARRAAVLALSKSGYNVTDIANKLKISRQRVYVLLDEAKKADFLAATISPRQAIEQWLAGRPDGSWTLKEMLKELYYIGNSEAGNQVETIKYHLRKLGYVPRWVHSSYVGAPLPEVQKDAFDLGEIIDMANANAEKIAAATKKPAEPVPEQEAVDPSERGVPEESGPRKQITTTDYIGAAIAAGRVPVPAVPYEDEISDDVDDIGF